MKTLHKNKAITTPAYESDPRLQEIQKKRWINYPAIKRIIKRIHHIYNCPRCKRMPSMLIHAQSDMGKTSLAMYILNKYPRIFNKQTGVTHIPIVYVEIPPVVKDERDFYIEILLAIGAPFNWSDDPRKLRQTVREILNKVGCKLLLIDELHNLLSGTPRQLRESLNALRFLSNQLEISLVCFGLDSTVNIIAADDQLADRMESQRLQPLRGNAALRKFVKETIRHYPLYGETDCANEELVEEILLRTGGIVGRITLLLQEAAMYAVEKKIEKITVDVLRTIGKQPPLVSMAKKKHAFH